MARLRPVDVDDLLGDLVDRSMLIVESGPFGRRFRHLERSASSGPSTSQRPAAPTSSPHRHASWCLGAVTHIGELLAGPAEIEGVARLDELWPNLRAAVEWACAANQHRLARALAAPIVPEVYLRSRSEIGEWAERILAIAPTDDEELILFGVSLGRHGGTCATWTPTDTSASSAGTASPTTR